MESILKGEDTKLIDYKGTQLSPDELLERISKLGFCVTDSKGYFVEVNDHYADFYGFAKDDLIGKHFTTVVPEAGKAFATKMHDDFINGSVEIPASWDVQKQDGSIAKVWVEAIRVVNNGQPSKLTTVEEIEE